MIARVCRADGTGFDTFDCTSVSLVCGAGQCVQPNVCGNNFCDSGETPSGCPADCATGCTPLATRCAGNTLYTCNGNGSEEAPTDCAAGGQICANGACRPADVCGNQLCESREDAASCAEDCAATCGNARCENGETTSCPNDCVICGDSVCGAGEIDNCPQDCGICIPSEKQCLGPRLRVCNANGTAYEDIDCSGFGLVCGGSDCVEPDVCGNSICDGDESQDTCAQDCGTVCGDNDCDPGEDFRTCSADCDPFCGDGTCEGREDSGSCALDCLEGCGDQTCAGLEDRGNCPGDCGYCGDGTCQDGAETSRLEAPDNLETCVSDCVVSGCQRPEDCDDGVDCTEDSCVQQKCVYTARDASCGGNERCIKFYGCCADADGDDYADEACGGSDCNDNDPSIHPGAPEVCGEGDKNCSGTHAARLLPARRLTNTPSAKRHMKVMETADGYIIAWTGTPTVNHHLEFMTVSDDFNVGPVRSVEDVEVDADGFVALDYNPVKHALGAMWLAPRDQAGSYTTSQGGWISTDGTLLSMSPPVTPQYGDNNCAGAFAFLTLGLDGLSIGSEVVFTGIATRTDRSYGYATGGWRRLTTSGSLSPILSGLLCRTSPGGLISLIELDGLMTGLGPEYYSTEPPIAATRLGTWDPDTTELPVYRSLIHPSGDGRCALGEDGELLTFACFHEQKLWYHRATQAGTVFYSDEIMTGDLWPLGLGKSDAAEPLVGVALRDAVHNLWFFVRSRDGEPVLEPAIIAGGGAIASAWVMHDGRDFQVFWLAKTGGVEQVYGQNILCE